MDLGRQLEIALDRVIEPEQKLIGSGGRGLGVRPPTAAWEEVHAAATARAFTKRGLVLGSLVLGVVLAVASLLYASPYQLTGGGG